MRDLGLGREEGPGIRHLAEPVTSVNVIRGDFVDCSLGEKGEGVGWGLYLLQRPMYVL